MLPGAMMRNKGLRYICRHVYIRVEQTDTPVTCGESGTSVENSDCAQRRKLQVR